MRLSLYIVCFTLPKLWINSNQFFVEIHYYYCGKKKHSEMLRISNQLLYYFTRFDKGLMPCLLSRYAISIESLLSVLDWEDDYALYFLLLYTRSGFRWYKINVRGWWRRWRTKFNEALCMNTRSRWEATIWSGNRIWPVLSYSIKGRCRKLHGWWAVNHSPAKQLEAASVNIFFT